MTFTTVRKNPAFLTRRWVTSMCEGRGSPGCDGTSGRGVERKGSTEMGAREVPPRKVTEDLRTTLSEAKVEHQNQGEPGQKNCQQDLMKQSERGKA